MSPDERLAQIAEDESARERREREPSPEDVDGASPDWCGVFVDRLKAEAALTDAYRTVFHAVKGVRDTSDVVDVGAVMVLIVKATEAALAEQFPNRPLARAAARLGTLIATESDPVDISVMSQHHRRGLN